MLDRRYWGLLVLAIGAGLLPAACGGEDSTTTVVVGPEAGTGVLGDSCSSPTDCGDGLRCISNTCVESSDDNEVALGVEGESCTRRADCGPGLQCLANVCSTDTGGDAQTGAGKRGETCQTRSDCASGLTCINSTCVTDDFAPDETDKTCFNAQCADATDCLGYDEEACAAFQDDCDASALSASCDYVRIYCDEGNWECEAGMCNYTGTCADYVSYFYACPNGYPAPSTGESVCDMDNDACVQCTDSVPCAGGYECDDGVCVAACEEDQDCPFFYTCNTDDGVCEEVGCQTDRECVAYTDNALAVCDTDSGDCSTPCDSDAECANPLAYNFWACIDGYCSSVGCDTDEECRIMSGSTASLSVCQ